MITIMSLKFVEYLSHLPTLQRSFSSGALIFEREDPVTSLYLVETGIVHLLRRQMDGGEYILQRASEGHILGEASLSTQSYHCSAVAVEPCTLRIYDAGQVNRLISQDGAVAQAYANYLGRELRNARLRAEISFLRKVDDRLSAWLAWHDNKLPQKGNWRRVAAEIGVSSEALYRELSRRRKLGLWHENEENLE